MPEFQLQGQKNDLKDLHTCAMWTSTLRFNIPAFHHPRHLDIYPAFVIPAFQPSRHVDIYRAFQRTCKSLPPNRLCGMDCPDIGAGGVTHFWVWAYFQGSDPIIEFRIGPRRFRSGQVRHHVSIHRVSRRRFPRSQTSPPRLEMHPAFLSTNWQRRAA